MRLILVLVAAVVALMVIGVIVRALRWMLIIAAVLVAVALLAGWRPGGRSDVKERSF
jgi:lysylphosphatidylglycerol synthetase-like protein (DUF2156 family)